jgi:hypothetical protein
MYLKLLMPQNSSQEAMVKFSEGLTPMAALYRFTSVLRQPRPNRAKKRARDDAAGMIYSDLRLAAEAKGWSCPILDGQGVDQDQMHTQNHIDPGRDQLFIVDCARYGRQSTGISFPYLCSGSYTSMARDKTTS